MAETLSVAMRVAEEAIDEAISKAEFDTANQVIDDLVSNLTTHSLLDPVLKKTCCRCFLKTYKLHTVL